MELFQIIHKVARMSAEQVNFFALVYRLIDEPHHIGVYCSI